MNGGKLTQDEINALLNDTKDLEEADTTPEKLEVTDVLTEIERDALGEIGNISFGSSATTLSTLLGQKVDITTPTVSLVKKTGLKEEFPYEHVSLQVNYIDGFNGENIFLMKTSDAAIISDIMLGGEGLNPKEELSEIELSAVQEAMNQMMGASATSMSTVFNKRVDISPPIVEYKDIDRLEEVENLDGEDVFVKVAFQIKIGTLIDSNIMQVMPLPFAKLLVEQLLNPPEVEEMVTESTQAPIKETTENEHVANTAYTGEEEPMSQETQYIGTSVNESSTIQNASFSSFAETKMQTHNKRNLDLLLDIPLNVTVELGRTNQKVADILDLAPGSIIELDKLAGEPVDVLVNQKLIAKGEVVVIDENFGVRVTDIISQEDRLLKLK